MTFDGHEGIIVLNGSQGKVSHIVLIYVRKIINHLRDLVETFPY